MDRDEFDLDWTAAGSLVVGKPPYETECTIRGFSEALQTESVAVEYENLHFGGAGSRNDAR
jgi:hypothetical protein